jgi:hypothetical protein
MNKTITITIITILLLTSLVSAKTIITQTKLETYTDLQVQNYIINNFNYTNSILTNNSLIIVGRINTLHKMQDKYLLTQRNIQGRVSSKLWNYCLTTYTLNQCKTTIIYNYGTFTYNNVSYKTINQQLKEKATNEYYKILSWRDYVDENVETTGDLTI